MILTVSGFNMFNLSDFIPYTLGSGSLENKDVLAWNKVSGYHFLKAQEAEENYFNGVAMKIIGARE